MHEIIGHALSVFMGFFAIMNPIANTPIFLGLMVSSSPGNGWSRFWEKADSV